MRSWVCVCVLAGCGFRPQAAGDAAGSAGDARPDVPPGFVPTSPRKLTFDNAGSATSLAQFQVLVALDATTIDYAMVGNPLTDLAFEDATMAKLPFEIESWNPAGESDVWVRVPLIPPGSSSILMSFGAGVGVGASTAPVWPGYEVVTHFTTPLASSSGPAHAPAAHNVAMVAGGRVATAVAFPATGDEQVNFASAGDLFDGWQAFTLAFSIYADYASPMTIASEPPILDKGGSLDLGRFYVNGGTTPGKMTLQIDMHFAGGGNDAYLSTEVTPRTWTDIVYTYDGTTLRLFDDGVQDGMQAMTGAPRAMLVDAQPFYLGNPIAPFKGMVDELRIEQAPRTADWARATHRSLARTFVTIGDP